MPNLLEISQGRSLPLSAGIFKAVKTEAPSLLAFQVRTSSTRKFMTLALTGLPTASGFKNLGEGFTHGDASMTLREFDAKLMGAKVQYELISTADWNRAHSEAGESWESIQSATRMAAEMRHLEKVLYYGTALDAKAFPGLKQLTPYVSPLGLTDDPGATDYTKTVVNAGGSTSSTASSVYSVISGAMDTELVVCNDTGGELFEMTEPIRQHIAPDASAPTATLEHEIFQISGWFGLSVSGMNETPNSVVPTQYAVRRLANLTNDSGKGVDDGKLEALVRSHGDNKRPSFLVMNGRSGIQWAASRNATAITLFLGGAGDAKNNSGNIQAKRPEFFDEIPVYYTSAILSTDAIEA